MYIGHITYDDVKNPWCGGGGAKRVFEVDRRLAKRHKIKVFTGKFPDCSDEIIDSVEFKRIGFGFNYIISRITFSMFIPFYILKEKFDIVVNEFSAYSPSFFFSRKQKNIIAIHHLVGKSPIKKYKLIGIFPYFFEKIIGIFYDYIITVSPSVTDIVKKKYKKNKIFRLIYNGVNNDLFSVIPREEDYIAFLGRIDMYMKGLDVLFEAFSKLKNKSVKLKFAGNGKKKDFNMLKTLAEKLGINHRIEFLGRISEEEKKDFLGKSLFVVMPSRFEGWGISAIESSACGKPVIGTNIPGLKDAIIHNETGILIESENSDILAIEMEKLLINKDERNRLGNNGRVWAKKFDWDRIAEEHEKFYLEVLGKNN